MDAAFLSYDDNYNRFWSPLLALRKISSITKSVQKLIQGTFQMIGVFTLVQNITLQDSYSGLIPEIKKFSTKIAVKEIIN